MSDFHWSDDLEAILAVQGKAVASASAGTGKTTFAIEKVIRGVKAGDYLANDVLCITFSREAAGDLKSRVRQRFHDQFHSTGDQVWLERARQIEDAVIGTIHSLALWVLREHPFEVGLDLGFDVLSEADAAEILETATEQVLRAQFEGEAGQFFARMADVYSWQDRGEQPGLRTCLAKSIKKWIENGADRESLRQTAAENWQAHPEIGKAFSETMIQAVETYETLKAGRLDYDDMIRLARNVLRDNLVVRRRFQEQFQLVVLDEAQDTDPLQMELIAYLAQAEDDEASWPDIRLSDKLLVVGDLKQSIYTFRGADHRQFQRLMDSVLKQDGSRASLQENRRCHPKIVQFVNALSPSLFAGVMDYKPGHDDLIAKRNVPDDDLPRVRQLTHDHPVDAKAEERRTAEAQDLARLILALVNGEDGAGIVFDDDTAPARRPRFGDIAMLFSRMTNLDLYTRALREHGVPFHVGRGKDFFQSSEVLDAYALLKLIQNPRDRLAFAEVLRCPAIALTDDQLLTVAKDADFRLDRVPQF